MLCPSRTIQGGQRVRGDCGGLAEARALDEKVTLQHQLGSAELISVHRQRVADVIPHGDEVD